MDRTAPEKLVEQLRRAAVDASTAAMEHFARGDYPRFIGEAVRAIELGAKCVLAKSNPVLIADPQSVESQLYFAGIPFAPKKQVRTVSVSEAVKRVQALIPELKGTDLDELIRARNGQTHFLGDANAAMHTMLSRYSEAIRLIGISLSLTSGDLFGPHADLVTQESLRQHQIIEVKVLARKQYCKTRINQTYDVFPDSSQILKVLEQSLEPAAENEQSVVCPACGHRAIVEGTLLFSGNYDVDVDEDGTRTGYPVVELHCESLRCHVCQFRLDGAAEFKAAGLEQVLEAENVEDPQSYVDRYDWEDIDY